MFRFDKNTNTPMTHQLVNYPKAFLEYLTTLSPMADDAQIIAVHESSVEVRSETLNITREIVLGDDDWMRIPYYFDKFGIHIDADANMFLHNKFCVNLTDDTIGKYYGLGDYHPTRLHAVKAAIPKAFEIREYQLNTPNQGN